MWGVFMLSGMGVQKNITSSYTWKLLLAILKIVDERKLNRVKRKNEKILMGLVFYFIFYSDAERTRNEYTRTRINFKRK